MAYENSIQVLQRFGLKQVQDAKRGLKDSKNLSRKIKSQVIGSFEATPVVKFTMPMYGAFVDTGVKGTGVEPTSDDAQPLKMKKVLNSKYANDIFKFKNGQPKFKKTKSMIPPKVLDKWVIQKGIKGTRDAKGRFVSRNSIKFAMAISIHRQGLTGTGFFTKPLQQNVKQMTSDLGVAYAKDLKENLIKQEYFV
tara:strand:+ start:1344 stop:1925 length:582 start_codon:yes stop_codon:yes gene_type:complete